MRRELAARRHPAELEREAPAPATHLDGEHIRRDMHQMQAKRAELVTRLVGGLDLQATAGMLGARRQRLVVEQARAIGLRRRAAPRQ
jgi:hypothetical protein